MLTGNLEAAFDWSEISTKHSTRHAPAFETKLKICLRQSSDHRCQLNIQSWLGKVDPTRLSHVISKLPEAELKLFCSTKSDVMILTACGERARILEQYPMAIEMFKKGIELENSNFVALANLGGIYHLTGDLPSAKQFYNRALEIRPNSELVKNNIRKMVKL